MVEAGCGWGALALHMARHYGVRVRAYNVSTEQIAHARECAGRERLEGRVEFVEGDYREIRGRCDAFVSVGMLEHVGRRSYAELGRVIAGCLERARPRPIPGRLAAAAGGLLLGQPWFVRRVVLDGLFLHRRASRRRAGPAALPSRLPPASAATRPS